MFMSPNLTHLAGTLKFLTTTTLRVSPNWKANNFPRNRRKE